MTTILALRIYAIVATLVALGLVALVQIMFRDFNRLRVLRQADIARRGRMLTMLMQYADENERLHDRLREAETIAVSMRATLDTVESALEDLRREAAMRPLEQEE